MSNCHNLNERISQLSVPFASVTAYDYPMAKLAEEAGIEVILVGDSLGMVVAGMEDTTEVTLDQMIYHCEMVARAVESSIVIADFPIDTYSTPKQAVENGKRLIGTGADATKLEGGFGQVPQIEALVDADIPVVGHLGMLPQRVREEGGYKKKGKTKEEADQLLAAAVQLEKSGVCMLVLESVLADIATQITEQLSIPTIGIGSGTDCSAQIRVLHDVIGAYPWFVPPFAKQYTDVAGQVKQALQEYRKELK